MLKVQQNSLNENLQIKSVTSVHLLYTFYFFIQTNASYKISIKWNLYSIKPMN